ncbi:aldo/keto reductase [Hyphobacterium sp.]|jgi:aryl-alcohol dehydrogenase-like predicted oxidoreductase|uniref:aldo/keto reductase n=1 Tax=Hyphobacterium sp. TaxID=2004662 RepID=UPI003BA9F56C
MSRLGFGVSGPLTSLLVDRWHVVRLIREAIDLGVTVFDTAPFYRDLQLPQGIGEQRLAAGIRGYDRSRLTLTTKVGEKRFDLHEFSPDAIVASVEKSLRRLGTDYIDYLFVQGAPASIWLDSDLLDCMDRLKGDKVAHIGVSGRDDEVEAAFGLPLIDALMMPAGGNISDAQADRIKRAKGRFRTFGIEVFSSARISARNGAFRHPGAALWYAARNSVGRPAIAENGPQPETREEAARRAIVEFGLDTVVTSTTSRVHLRNNKTLIDTLDGAPGAA